MKQSVITLIILLFSTFAYAGEQRMNKSVDTLKLLQGVWGDLVINQINKKSLHLIMKNVDLSHWTDLAGTGDVVFIYNRLKKKSNLLD